LIRQAEESADISLSRCLSFSLVTQGGPPQDPHTGAPCGRLLHHLTGPRPSPPMGSSSTYTYVTRKAENMAKLCSARGCHLPRGGLDSMCSRHRSTYRRLGHPSARPLPRRDWLPYKVALEHLFSLNEGHAGLVEAERFVDSFVKRGIAHSEAYKGAQEMQRLASHGVTSRDILVTVLAVLEHQRRCTNPPPDQRSEDFQLSRAVFALAPQVVKPGWRGLRTRPYRGRATHSALCFVGKHLRGALAEFAATVGLGLEAQAQAKAMSEEERRAARTAPMQIAYR
jgi:hypothetical protein